MVNDNGIQQALDEYPIRQKNGHLSTAPLRLVVDRHIKGQHIFTARYSNNAI